jgi:monoamine oxidase
MIDYDICIIGAGISGLYCAREITKMWPDASICIMEKYEFLGGRVSTFKKTLPNVGHVQWEAGAGRIHNSHTLTLDLLRGYNIDVIPITGGIDWRSEYTDADPIEFGKYIENLSVSQISPGILQKKTLRQILDETLGKDISEELTDRYEYRSELDTLRADKGIDALNHELGKHEGFFVVKGGFSKLIAALKHDVERADVKILREYEARDIHPIKNGYSISVEGHLPIRASKVIVAIPRDSVALFPCFKNLQILKQVKMRPLVRIYAVFPLVNGKSWFTGIQKFVCPAPIRFVIPMDPMKGTIMISYTDGSDAEYWIKRIKDGDKSILDEIMKQIRELFPKIDIPNPSYFKIHPWSDGCSYWTPGSYSIDSVSMASIIPLPKEMPGVYMCNESWAKDQCWVNSAIEQSNYALKVLMEN